jgi:hypothetical protein
MLRRMCGLVGEGILAGFTFAIGWVLGLLLLGGVLWV